MEWLGLPLRNLLNLALGLGNPKFLPSGSPNPTTSTPLEKLQQINLFQLLYLPAVAILVYCLEWPLHLQQNPTTGFWELQKQMLSYHGRIGSGPNVHPYCSAWYTWPWMIRPVDYFYQTALNTSEPVPAVGPRLPQSAAKVIYDVHAMGNPVLWWLSTAAILILVWVLARRIEAWLMIAPSAAANLGQAYSIRGAEFWLPLYLVMNYAANFYPGLVSAAARFFITTCPLRCTVCCLRSLGW